jgi:hypothetical protein
MATRKSVIPLCLGASGSVRAATQYQSAKCADVVKRFCPLRTHPPSVFVAFRLSAARSDPALGSE